MRKKLLKKQGGPARPPPKAVQDLISADFIRRLRDGGPQAQQSVDVPPTNTSWIASDPAETARNVVNALCYHRYGDGVVVDEVHAGPARASGVEYMVTLTLSDRDVLGSCNSIQVRDFDRDTTAMLEGLREVEGWNQPIYRLKVQTPGIEGEMRIPEDLWKCEVFPCHVVWQQGGSRYDRYLNLVANTTDTWRLADTDKNWNKKPSLTKAQREMTFSFGLDDIRQISVYMDAKSHKKLMKLKQWMKSQSNATESEQKQQLSSLADQDDEEDDDLEGEEDFDEDFDGAFDLEGEEEEEAQAARELEVQQGR